MSIKIYKEYNVLCLFLEKFVQYHFIQSTTSCIFVVVTRFSELQIGCDI